MEFGEAARTASHDQVHAAQADVARILGGIAGGRQRRSRIDTSTQGRIEALLRRVFAEDGDPATACPHARHPAFDSAPRPLVLDAVRGILACSSCYLSAVGPGSSREPLDATCFDCGRGLGRLAGPDLFIAYGPILVVAALCQQCWDRMPPEPSTEPDAGA